MVTHNGFVAFDANDAEATRSDFPDLALLWCFLFHASTIPQDRENARDFFIFIFLFFSLDTRLGTASEQEIV